MSTQKISDNSEQKLQRIDTIDIIRGYFLFVIIIDHLARFFGFFDLFTGGGRQWVSAAEGFFFISGMMIGLVRAKKLKDKPLFITTKKTWSRALQLYIWSVVLTFFFVAVAQFHLQNPGIKEGAFTAEPLSKLISHTFLLRYVYGWADYLAYYVIYLLFTPFAAFLLRKGKWLLLLATSVFIYILADNLQLSWQLLFFSGTIIGFYLPEIEAWAKKLSNVKKRLLYGFIFTVGIGTLLISLFFNTYVAIMATHPNWPGFGLNFTQLHDYNTYTLAPWFDKYRLAIGRLSFFYFWFVSLYIAVRRFEPQIKKWLGWFFIPYGQNSLYVYIVHAFILYFLNLALPTHLSNYLNILINTLVLAILWVMVKKKILFSFIPR